MLCKNICNLITPLLILLTLAHYKPWIKGRILSTTLPNNEWLANDEEMACISLTLSPSIISLVKPVSTENSSDLLHASNSASSLVPTFSPLAIIAAITSPLSLRTIAPTLDFSNPEKTTASKLSL